MNLVTLAQSYRADGSKLKSEGAHYQNKNTREQSEVNPTLDSLDMASEIEDEVR